MMTTMTQREWKAEQEAKGLSEHDRLKRLTGGNERLTQHAWSDEALQRIPEDLVQFAYENSEALRKEFPSLSVFLAYRTALAAGQTKSIHASGDRGTINAR